MSENDSGAGAPQASEAEQVRHSGETQTGVMQDVSASDPKAGENARTQAAESRYEGAKRIGGFESPPVAPAPVSEELPDPRMKLLRMAADLAQSPSRRLLIEYLRLRRMVA